MKPSEFLKDKRNSVDNLYDASNLANTSSKEHN